MQFGDYLKALRLSSGLTQKQLAEAIGVEQSSICKYEGKTKVIPSDSVKEQIADYFGVSIDFLMGRSEEAKNQFDFDDETMDLISRFTALPPDKRHQLIEYAQFLQAYQPASTAVQRSDDSQDQ